MTRLLLLFAALAAYDQPYRPQYHFSPRQNWTNDPNGLVYFEGEYHLFFQYNPFGDEWGHMSWGHAVSRDLVHWEELGVALAEENGVMIFTGSTVVDERNTSGFCENGKPCLVAVYTGHTPARNGRPALQTQNLAYSNDRGRTWTKYSGNPVLNLNLPDFRDPNVFWSEQGKGWIMAVSLPNEHKIRLYGSGDLKHWQMLSDFGPAGATGGQWECPDLFELPVEGRSGETRWVLKVGLNPGGLQGGSGEQYFVGKFDGTRFVNDNPPATTLWTDYGKDCYCALTFNGIPRGRPAVMMGWMSNWQYAGKAPTAPWRGQMTAPRALALQVFPEGIRLVQRPAAALTALRQERVKEAEVRNTFEMQATADPGAAQEVGWRVLISGAAYTAIGYDRRRQEIFVDRTQSGKVEFSKDFPARMSAPLRLQHGEALHLHVFVDRSSVEVFAQDGRVAITSLVFPDKDAREVQFYSRGGDAGPERTEMWRLKSIW